MKLLAGLAMLLGLLWYERSQRPRTRIPWPSGPPWTEEMLEDCA